MKKSVELELTPETLAYGLAKAFDDDQAMFLNALAEHLKCSCKDEQRYNAQLHSIVANKNLRSAGKRLIKDLHEMLVIAEAIEDGTIIPLKKG